VLIITKKTSEILECRRVAGHVTNTKAFSYKLFGVFAGRRVRPVV
jgi:hypothetical protein